MCIRDRSIGDAGDGANDYSGYTVLYRLFDIVDKVNALRQHIDFNVIYGLATTTPLDANASYTQGWLDRGRIYYAYVLATIYSDVDGMLYIEQSPDSSNVDRQDNLSYTGGDKSGNLLKVQVMMRYIRLRYVNGATAQSVFRLGYRWSEV